MSGDRYIGEALRSEDLPATATLDSELLAHTGNTSNPHEVTASQAGAQPLDATLTALAAGTLNEGLLITLPATESIVIDGQTNPRQITAGALRLQHQPAASTPGTRPITLNISAGGQVVYGMEINYTSGSVVAGTDTNLMHFHIDKSTSTGGSIDAVHVDISSGNGAAVAAVHVGAGVSPIHQVSGAGVAPTGWKLSGAVYTDITAAMASSVTDVALFSANGDQVFIGYASTFDEIQVELQTVASGAGVKPAFAYWNGAAWTTFNPLDGTNGFRQSGSISFTSANLAGWVATAVNGVAKFWVRITRTQNTIATAPVEDTIVVIPGVTYEWDADGNLIVNSIAYAPAVPANWSPAPTTIAQALDQLAARVKALEP